MRKDGILITIVWEDDEVKHTFDVDEKDGTGGPRAEEPRMEGRKEEKREERRRGEEEVGQGQEGGASLFRSNRSGRKASFETSPSYPEDTASDEMI